MDMTSQSGFFTDGVYPFNHNICPAVKKDFSAKAKAFTIDALLSTDKEENEPVTRTKLAFQTKMVNPMTPQTLLGGKRSGNEINMNTSGKEQNEFSSSEDIVTYKEFSQELTRANMRCESKQKGYLPLRKTVDSPHHFNSPSLLEVRYYSPLMTNGFFRPVECYSPMSYEGQGTPAGLKTFYQTPSQTETLQYGMSYTSDTSDPKNNSLSLSNGYFTPKEKHGIPISGGRKILSSRKHERSHPYLSLKHKMTPDKSDIEKLFIQESPNTVLKGRTEKGKRHRTAFTSEQLQCLEAEFEKQQYLVGEERCHLAESLNLTVSQVKVWFQNRRIKWRKEQYGQGKNNNIDVQQ